MNRLLKVTLKHGAVYVFTEPFIVVFYYDKDRGTVEVMLKNDMSYRYDNVIECIFE